MKTNSIDIFLENWKQQAIKFYNNVKAEKAIALKEKKYKEWDNKYGATTINFIDRAYTPEIMNTLLDKEVQAKKNKLIQRTEKVVGKIIDTKNVSISANMELNGMIIGENGKCTIQTIYAGGHNIQRLHYRVLVKKVK